MTDAEAVSSIATDASVRQAHRRTGAGGVVVEANPAELQAIAKLSLVQAVTELMINPDIADKLFEIRYTLTVTSGTLRYNVGQYKVTKIREILLGSNERPVRPFFEDSGDFYEWKERRYGAADMSGASEPYAAYISGRVSGLLELSFWPGVGDESSVILVHNRLPVAPFMLSSFPDHMHGAIVTGAVRFANGGSQGYSDQWENIKSDIARGLDPARGTTTPIRKSEELRKFIRRQNARVAGASSAYASSSKTF